MSNAKRRTFIALQAMIVVLFVIAVIFGISATNVKADDVQINGVSEQTAESSVKNLMVNGNVPQPNEKGEGGYDARLIYANQASTPLQTSGDIMSFLQGEKSVSIYNPDTKSYVEDTSRKATIGYLINDMQFCWTNGVMTNVAMKDYLTFDGNGKKLTLTTNQLNAQPWVTFDVVGGASGTFFSANGAHSSIDINGAFIGYIPTNSKIINTNFIVNTNISGTQSTSGSGCGGYIAGYCSGVIDNCSVTVKSNTSFNMIKASDLSASLGRQNEFMSRNSYAFGGFVGVLTGASATISNSKIDLESNSLLYVETRACSSTTINGHGRVFLGGVAGWMGNGAMAYNLYTAGSGTLQGLITDSHANTAYAEVGVAVGSNIYLPNNLTANNAISGSSGVAHINGVINTWTGVAKCYTSGASFSPLNKTGVSEVYGMVVGMSGNENDHSENTNNIYCLGNMYASGDWHSIGYSGATGTTTRTGNVVTMQYRKDDDSTLVPASSDKAYLTWGGTENGSDIWAVYDISSDKEHILWANEIIKRNSSGVIGENLQNTYYWRNDSIQDAKDNYDLTYTVLKRGLYPNVEINYEFGRAAYLYKIFSDGVTAVGSDPVNRDDAEYGDKLDIPEIRLYSQPNTTAQNALITTIRPSDPDAYSYWKTLKGTSKNPVSADDYMEIGEYTTFLYLDNPSGSSEVNYNNIHFLDTSKRVVAYIKDDPNYITYAQKYKDNTGNDYSHIDAAGLKSFDWQPRIRQEVVQKSVSLDIVEPAGVPIQPDPSTQAKTTEYQGRAVVFSASVPTDELVMGDQAVTATLEYYQADENFNKGNKVSAATDVGNYIVRPVSLNNSNYRISEDVEDVKLTIKKRATIVQMNSSLSYEAGSSAYRINLDYNGVEQLIKFGRGKDYISQAEMQQNNYAFYFYNVETVDLDMIQIDILGMDENNLDYYNAIDVPEDYVVGQPYVGGSYQVIISFADGSASSNYSLPNPTRFIVTIVPAKINFQDPQELNASFVYGNKTPESDGYYAYGIANNGAKVEPTEAIYERFNYSTGKWESYDVEIDGPIKNVGEYRITYKITNKSESNYLDSEETYQIEITAREVTFTVTPGQETQYTFGADYKPGGGTFGVFNSSNNTGLSTIHGTSHQVEFRYQYVGEPLAENQDPMAVYHYRQLTDMTEIYQLPSEIWDIGCYIVYPVLLLNGAYDADEVANYEFHLQTTHVNVGKLTVRIELKDVRKEYSKPVDAFIGEANADEAVRSWKYVGTETFRFRDNIVVNLITDANAGSEVGSETPIRVSSIKGDQGVAGVDGSINNSLDKSNNYNVVIVNEDEQSYLTVDPLTINIRTFIDVRSVIYGEALPKPSYEIAGENTFMAGDDMDETAIWVYTLGDTVLEGLPKNVGTYEVGIDFSNNEKAKNYKIIVSGAAVFNITPREIKINVFDVKDANVDYNGRVQYPETTLTFHNLADGDEDTITVGFNFFNENGEIENNPKNVGTYTAKVDENRILNVADGSLNNNYVLVKNEGNVEFKTATVTINPVNVTVNVNNAVRVYHIPGSLKAVKTPTDDWSHFEYIAEGELPYSVTSGRFFATDEIGCELFIDEYFEELKVHEGVVKIRFTGDAVEAGNYRIDYNEGDLLVIDANFDDIGEYFFVTFNGERYIDVEESVVYTGENLYSKFDLYAHNDAIKNALSIGIATDEQGKNMTTEVINAATYYMVIKPSGADSPFTGEKIIPFEVHKATRVITADDIVMEVHYNKLVFSSKIPGLQYSVNGEAYLSADSNNTYEYSNVSPLNNYSIRVRVEEGIDPNYKESNVLDIYARTGCNAGDLANRINALQTITFSNMSTYRALKAQLIDVHEDDLYLIDNNKIAALDASLAKLLSDASAVVAGAQDVTAKAVGKSNNSATATALALSSTGIGLSAVGLMLGIVAKKRKEDEEEKTVTKKSNGKKYAKKFILAITIMLVAVMVFVGCKDTTMKQEELLDLASYKVASNEKSRDYEITVSHGSTIIYRNENGVETTNENVTAPSFALGSNGSGLDFNVDYFENISYVTSRTTASFTADVSNVSAFLGRANATNATVKVIADIQEKRLTSIEISYNEGEFKTKIVTTLSY
ncbi:MAG: hypothetical protein K2J89_01850 [Clostridia bacterium]|nr:hypothetical protein [Clostridia bacterium]